MAPVTDPDIWQVVGGAPKGGLVVRADKDKSSREVPGRLATGALVLALEYDAEASRMLFQKVQGSGPETGWIRTAFGKKELLVRTCAELSVEEACMELQDEESGDDLGDSEELAIQLYSARFGVPEAEDGDFAGLRKPNLHSSGNDGLQGESVPESEVRAELVRDLSTQEPSSEADDDDLESFFLEGSDMLLCYCCGLPLGKRAYSPEEDTSHLMHGECIARIVLLDVKKTQADREEQGDALKRERREEYDIGWKAAEHIPRNSALSSRLHGSIPQGLCCVVLDEETSTVSLSATLEPAAAVNLEYLFTALEVRRRNNREPLFSLDPLDGDDRGFMQAKRFEPAWLAGTSVGEVLFQSDYHLKELSMGEYEQPVVGMRSCHDFSDLDEPEWSAREWFVVRKAEVQKSRDNVLIPQVRMGVEAREQIRGDRGMEDVKTTKPSHPLVRYAEMFTHNFDLIAERKSVVHQLRELAKASVLAKFLVEADVKLDEAWFTAGETKEAYCLEIPQLWNDRYHSQIRMRDGELVDVDSTVFGTSFHSLYGGVQFGLDRFPLSGARASARTMSAGLAARQFIQPSRHLGSTLSAGLATRQFQRSFGPLIEPSRVAAGVRLDKFSLSGARGPARIMSAGLAARQFVQPARHLASTLSAGLATRQFQRSFGPVGIQPARVSTGVGLDKFALAGARAPARVMSAGLAARQFVQPARHLTATLSAGLATRQFQRSFGPVGLPGRVAAGISFDKFALSGPRQPARLMSAGLAARQFVQPARHLGATLSAGLATRQFQRSFGPVGVQPARVAAGVSMDKFALSGMRQPARMLSAGLAARQFVQPARHLAATLSAGLATRQFQRSFGPVGVQPARVSASIGMDKFSLAGARQPARMLSAGIAARQFVQPARSLSASLSAGLSTRQFQRSFGPVGIEPAMVSGPRGVDLNLDQFNLSAPTEAQGPDMQLALAAGADITASFWANLENDVPSAFHEEDRQLLKKVFNPALSDRRSEGDEFIPPDTNFEYVQRLRALVQKEEGWQRRRMAHFFSTDFNRSSPGELFPGSWASTVEISCEDDQKKQGSLHVHPGYKSQAHLLTQVLASTDPVFDRNAEDGTRFRIYCCGSLEVRTTQEAEGKEEVGAVFSTRPVGGPPAACSGGDKIVKATEYVESSSKGCHSYIVLETEKKQTVVTERKNDGTMKWRENPRGLEERNSFAKVLRSAEAKTGKTVKDIRGRENIFSLVTGDMDMYGFMAK